MVVFTPPHRRLGLHVVRTGFVDSGQRVTLLLTSAVPAAPILQCDDGNVQTGTTIDLEGQQFVVQRVTQRCESHRHRLDERPSKEMRKASQWRDTCLADSLCPQQEKRSVWAAQRQRIDRRIEELEAQGETPVWPIVFKQSLCAAAVVSGRAGSSWREGSTGKIGRGST